MEKRSEPSLRKSHGVHIIISFFIKVKQHNIKLLNVW